MKNKKGGKGVASWSVEQVVKGTIEKQARFSFAHARRMKGDKLWDVEEVERQVAIASDASPRRGHNYQ